MARLGQSRIGRLSLRSGIDESERFIAIKAHLDSSGQPSDRYVTLAAFVASDATWLEFERGWDEILKSGFRPVDYMHMRKAVRKGYGTPFSYTLGWDREKIWDLIFKLAQYMSTFKNGILTMHSCEIDMEAWRSLVTAGYDLPSDVELCNRYVCEAIMGLFAKELISNSPSEVIHLSKGDLLSFIFDRNERFMGSFSEKVNREKDISEKHHTFSVWQLVDSVTEANMQTVPGIQAADILAWGVNRQNIADEGSEGKHLAYILRQIVRCTWKVFDEAALRKEFLTL